MSPAHLVIDSTFHEKNIPSLARLEAQYLTAATSGPYVISITAAAATELPWEQFFADTQNPPPLNRE